MALFIKSVGCFLSKNHIHSRQSGVELISQVLVDPDTNATKEEIAVAPDRLSDAFSVYQKELNKQKTDDKKDLNKKKASGNKYLKKQKAR